MVARYARHLRAALRGVWIHGELLLADGAADPRNTHLETAAHSEVPGHRLATLEAPSGLDIEAEMVRMAVDLRMAGYPYFRNQTAVDPAKVARRVNLDPGQNADFPDLGVAGDRPTCLGPFREANRMSECPLDSILGFARV